MTINYGKREPGGLTASSPGDTLYFPFASYNDSGDSEALTGLAATDIEVFKNGIATTRATDSGYSLISDTGQVGDRVGLYRCSIQLFNTADDTGHYEIGAHYMAAIDAVTIDGRTVRFWLGTWEIGREQIHDTGIYDRISNLDTGLRSFIGDVDTGLHDTIADLDTGLRDYVNDVDTGLRAFIDDIDTGLRDTLADYDTGLRDFITDTDTGIVAGVWEYSARTLTSFSHDTGIWFSGDTGTRRVNARMIDSDTGAAGWLRATYAQGFADTGVNDNIKRIRSDVDTGLRDHINDIDTGLRDHIDNTDSGIRAHIDDLDTGVKNRFDKLAEDTGGVNVNSIQGDTGAAGWLRATFASGFTDTGLNDRLARIQSDVDTGLRVHIDDSDTGLKDAIADLDTGLRDFISDTDTGLRAHIDNIDTGIMARFDDLSEDTGGVNVNAIGGDTGAASHLAQAYAAQNTNSDTGLIANAAAVRAQTDKLTFDTGNELGVDVKKVNNVTVTGTGANGNEWRPA